eukprot:9423070-Lingulodinium_polyedra.AAC.1
MPRRLPRTKVFKFPGHVGLEPKWLRKCGFTHGPCNAWVYAMCQHGTSQHTGHACNCASSLDGPLGGQKTDDVAHVSRKGRKMVENGETGVGHLSPAISCGPNRAPATEATNLRPGTQN